MSTRVKSGRLSVAKPLYDFVNEEALAGTGVEADQFWSALDEIVADLTPKNRALLGKRADLQSKISAWHKANPGLDSPSPIQ